MLIPSFIQWIAEKIYLFVLSIIKDQIGKNGFEYFSFIITLFIFILTCNFIGIIPYQFTVTSHVAVTFCLSFTIFFGVTIIGFIKHGLGYFDLLKPAGINGILLGVIFVIEFISYLTRAFSLGIRLAANLLAGHSLLYIISSFTISFIIAPYLLINVLSLGPIVVLVAITGLELVIAFLQAYVFTVLTCSYLNEALHLH